MNVALVRALFWATTVAVLAVISFPVAVEAQPLAGSTHGDKISGSAYWPLPATKRRIESARNYAQEFQTYVKNVPQPEPSVVKDIKTELGRYLDEGYTVCVDFLKVLTAQPDCCSLLHPLASHWLFLY